MTGRIEDYALIGDCETAALVGRDGSIDWLCWPCFDSAACFAALLGTAENGRWLIAPVSADARTTRRYRDDTLILETLIETPEGAVTLTEFMPPRGKASDIVRMLRGERGVVAMRMELIIRFGFGAYIPWVRRLDDNSVQAICGPDMVVLRSPIETHGEGMTTVATFEVHAGDAIPFVLTYGPSYLPPPDAIDVDTSLRDTETLWRDWSAIGTYTGEHRAMVMRSLITLKALTYRPSGGIVAAPTTSLPEKLGGARNWDYRFCWIRDAAFTLLALTNNGYTEEAVAWHDWLLRAVAGTPDDMQIMYGITGERRLPEWEAEWLAGYEGARPVRIGNAAHAQLQLDVYGELLDSFFQARVHGQANGDTWALECQLLKSLADIWAMPDSGIWERRGKLKHYVSSKALTWLAFDRGIKSVEQFGLEGPVDEWRILRAIIHADVCAKGFDSAQNAFVQSYGSDMLDASVLMLPLIGFLPPDDPRIVGTIAAIESRLMPDGFVLRHDPRDRPDEQPLEGAFLACSFWLADAHVLSGDLDKAHVLFDRLVAVANDLGLLAEQYDTVARRQVGNFPQALTHIALINTAQNLCAASQKPAKQRSAC